MHIVHVHTLSAFLLETNGDASMQIVSFKFLNEHNLKTDKKETEMS